MNLSVKSLVSGIFIQINPQINPSTEGFYPKKSKNEKVNGN